MTCREAREECRSPGEPNKSFTLSKSSPPNFKWFFEGVTYTTQGWGSAEKPSGVFIFKNRFCQAQATP